MFEKGEKSGKKLYCLLEGEVDIKVSVLKTFAEMVTQPDELVDFLIKNFEDICWQEMTNGKLIKKKVFRMIREDAVLTETSGFSESDVEGNP